SLLSPCVDTSTSHCDSRSLRDALPISFLLIGPLESESAHIGARGHFDAADVNVVQTVRNDLPDGLLRIDSGPCLVHIGQLDGLPDRKSTRLNSSHVSISYAVFCFKKHT